MLGELEEALLVLHALRHEDLGLDTARTEARHVRDKRPAVRVELGIDQVEFELEGGHRR